MADNVDDIFVSLGGSLMRDLLADLQSGGDDEGTSWSLEQLEKELAHLEQPATTAAAAAAFAAPSAASIVVSHAQERRAVMNPSYLDTPQPSTPGDAWSSSLERFTAMSLEQDFLDADSARKQNTKPTGGLMADFSQAEDYNISELAALSPPPGLRASTKTVATAVLSPQAFGMTDVSQESRTLQDIAENEDATNNDNNAEEVNDQVAALRALLHITQPKVPPPNKGIPRPPPPTPQTSISGFATLEGMNMYVGQPMMDMSGIPQGHVVMSSPPPHHQHQQQQQQHGPPGGVPDGMPLVVPAGGIPIAAAGMPPNAWQTPPKAHPYASHPMMTGPPPPTPPMPRVFCASHPAAPPIPAGVLESKLMNARDIAYVVHSILKPLLLLGTSESDYDIQFLRRCGDASSGATPNKPKDAQQQQEVQSRLVKSKDWSTKHQILGHVAKTNVTRPRALIATPTASSEQVENSEQRDRANLWKARIYVDQGYQAYLGLSGAWLASRSGGGGPGGSIQLHLKKLLKCFGTTPPSSPESDYTVVEPAALELLVKLDKGKVLVARVIEQALLPPAAVLAMLPHLLKALLATPPSSSMMDAVDDRVFRSLAFAIQTLPQLTPDALIASLQQVLQTDNQVALSSMARMECVHALLLRGSTLSAQSSPVVNETFPQEWNRLEGELMAILGG